MTQPINSSEILDFAGKEAKKQTADPFEIYFEKVKKLSIECKDGHTDSFTQATDQGLSIRILSQGKMGFSYTTEMTESSIRSTIEKAKEIAKYIPEKSHLGFQNFKDHSYPSLQLKDDHGLSRSTEEKIQQAIHLEKKTRAIDSRISGVRTANFKEVEYEVGMQDHLGNQIGFEGSLFSASVLAKAGTGDDQQMGGGFDFHTHFDQVDFDFVAKEAADSALELLGASQAPTMTCPAIFRNDVVSSLVGFMASSFSIENIEKGRSLLAKKQGGQIFSKKIKMEMNGLYEGGYDTAPFDAEGTPSQILPLIEDGVLTSYLYDLHYANKLSKTPSGCTSRGIKSAPSIGTRNLLIQPGSETKEDWIGTIEKGILITDLMGLHTANPITGDFSLGASGILIEKGKLTQPVKGFAVAGNILDVFKNVQSVGSDFRLFGSVGVPSLLVERISVGGNS
ncbi:MAG: peptidase [Bdellovibrionaceae bacterium]|nr:peptidase [Pseudobdellovibrionaceae bacterium]|tara:strand:- start:4424 stop:5776 length:1353 start_codon:yes stop_codon:yes gene_type:complete